MIIKKHVILDTDIGCDPDDIITVLLAFNSPELHIDLILTSDEYQGYKALFLKEIIKLMDLKILIRSGNSLNRKKYALMSDSKWTLKLSKNNDYLEKIEEIIERNKKTYYVCIGPQTNVAKFLDFNSSLITKFELIIMGGSINYRHKGKADFNIRSDLYSARKVFKSKIHKRYVLSDITFHPKLAVDNNHSIFKLIKNSNCRCKYLIISNFGKFFSNFYPCSYMNDPLTLSYLINPKLISFKEKKLIMDPIGRFVLSKRGKPTLISTTAQYSNFMNSLENRLREYLI